MNPIYLDIKDFTNHGHSYIDFSKLSNAILIIGRQNGNEKSSNTCGKTNIFNAIKYCLFNSKIFDIKTKIIRNGAKKCSVEFCFEFDNEVYKINRYSTKSASGAKIFKKTDNEWKDISDKTTIQTDQKILDIIGINEQTFENTFYLKQNDYKKRKLEAFAAATPEQRKTIIIDLLSLDIWEKFKDSAKQLKDETEKNITSISSKIEFIGNPKNDIEQKTKLIQENNQNETNISENITKLQQSLEDKKTQLITLKQSLSNDIPDLTSKLNSEKTYLISIQKDINSLKNLILSKQQQKEVYEKNIDKYTNDSLLFTTQLNSFENIKQTDYTDNDLQVASNNLSMTYTELSSLQSQLKIINKPIPKDKICDKCGTELNDEHRKLLEDRKNKEKEIINSKINELLKSTQSLENEKQIIQNSINEYKSNQAKISELKVKIKSINDSILFTKTTIDQLNQLIESSNKDLDQKINSYNDGVERGQKIANQLAQIDDKTTKNNIKILENEIFELSNNIKNQSSNIEKLKISTGTLKSQIESLQNNIQLLKEYNLKKSEYDKEILIQKAAILCFSSSGIPATIINTVLDSYQTEANNILQQLKPGLQIQFVINKDNGKDTLDIIYLSNGTEFDFSALSGGQQAIVVLALKLALANISRKRCGSNINILLLDEVEQALDDDSIEGFYKIIKKMSENMIIMVITHNKDLKKKFDSIIIVNKINDISSIEVKCQN